MLPDMTLAWAVLTSTTYGAHSRKLNELRSRVTPAYRTASTMTLQVVAGIRPIDLLAQE